jgi:hypothetical protein
MTVARKDKGTKKKGPVRPWLVDVDIESLR